jgi:tRNA threonylcarbamoyladenosine biosynthesis protein TsaE
MQNFNSKLKSKSSIKFISKSLEDTKKFAQKFVDDLKDGQNIVLLQGNLGAGKTTFSQAVLEYLGAEGPFTSPTFVIMKDYEVNFENKNRIKFKKVYHLDCYRIDEESLDDLNWNDITEDKENLILLEWPEKIEKALPKKYVKIGFEVLGEKKRGINIS